MIFHICLRIGPWMFQNGHLYRETISRNKHFDRTPIQWKSWTCVFCGKCPHQKG